MKRSRSITFTILFLSLTACGVLKPSYIPAVPIERVTNVGGVMFISLPIKIRHTHFEYLYFDEYGERKWKTSAVDLFPIDVFVSYDPDNQVGRVFLARSPHMGCLLNWESNTQKFEDPCAGSQFSIDGVYQSGPSPRNLDELPVTIRDGMIWIKPEVIYGEGHE